MKKKVIVFEEIFPGHRWAILWHRWRGCRIFFIRLNRKTKETSWARLYIEKGYLEYFDINFYSRSYRDGYYLDVATETVDGLFAMLAGEKIVRTMKTLYGSDKVELIYKNYLVKGCARIRYLMYLNDKFRKELGPGVPIQYVPADGVEFFRTEGCEISDYKAFRRLILKGGKEVLSGSEEIHFVWWAELWNLCRQLKWKGKTFCSILAFPFYVTARSLSNRLRTSEAPLKQHYKFLFNLFNLYGQIDNRISHYDFLVKDNDEEKRQSLFFAYKKLNKETREYLASNKLNFVDDISSFLNIANIKEVVPPYVILLRDIFSRDQFLTNISLKIIYYFLLWRGFSERIKVDYSIICCDFGAHSIARNIILEKAGTRNCFYIDSANFGCFFVKDEAISRFRSLVSYLYYDCFISWSPKIIDYLKSSQCFFRENLDAGCLWSEHVRLLEEKKSDNNLLGELIKQGYRPSLKLVGVFDSSYNDPTCFTYRDGIMFIEGILKLLNDFPDVFVVLKEKKNRKRRSLTQEGRVLVGLYEELNRHPRGFSLPRRYSSSEIIALSDLVISFPFTSTTFEALGARRRAFWFDPADKFRGVYYDTVSGLVCHNYKELSSRTKELLFEETEETYARYLDSSIKGKIESYLDGQAITRLKNYFGIQDVNSGQNENLIKAI